MVSLSTCSRREPMGISGRVFYGPDVVLVTSPKQQCRSTRGNTKHSPYPFFLHHQTLDVRVLLPLHWRSDGSTTPDCRAQQVMQAQLYQTSRPLASPFMVLLLQLKPYIYPDILARFPSIVFRSCSVQS